MKRLLFIATLVCMGSLTGCVPWWGPHGHGGGYHGGGGGGGYHGGGGDHGGGPGGPPPDGH